MVVAGLRAFDADNHYYETLDAFTRHIEPEFARRCMQWAQVDGKTRLLVGGKVNRFLPNPTFSALARPGALEQYFRGEVGGPVIKLFGELAPPRPEYQNRDARLRVMDELRLDGAFFFPTLGVGMERALKHDLPAARAAFRAFNRWLDEDWGFAYQNKIFAAPYISLSDPAAAVTELRWALDRGVRIIVMRAGPVLTEMGLKSPADRMFDEFWALANEAGVVCAYHGGDDVYKELIGWWSESDETEAFRMTPLRSLLSPSAVADSFAALLAQGTLRRNPNLRFAAIETGADWVTPLFKSLKKSFVQNPDTWAEDPRETFRRQVWVSPFHENDLAELKTMIGADRMLMGSDWPHVEGLAEPLTFTKDLEAAGFDDAEIQLVMHDNAQALIGA
ncbi:amidohydrolase family protein [Frankia sp. CNm7]|uniref:Amidohydrolase family protein n=1 Tax=Frankia nepalensis TaxID=1836974 RepID=A0A937RBH8_9ACTN|nr:amidohydrolase family protein [Frankia nepalensis]MBL7496656.1 amidohydrolase family protein [Frankia nepalensis]MBL7510702.1 amidohydrolase family protein [Frankia nepalensis]MBL7516665.1 amidohydrolase family protein [Frankia nepalensis]MBL7627395.1 amidohydrolase family protein [Frankia nepalensis]